MSELAQRIQQVEARIKSACEACGRTPDSVELLPVSKRQSTSLIVAAAELGYRRFGENYVQEACAKAQELPNFEFVLIGPLQRNKVKPALLHFQEIMSVDRPELALRLGQLAEELDIVRKIWIQVDLWGESTKLGGCEGSDLPALIQTLSLQPRLQLEGFMAIPPPEQTEAFSEVALLREVWQNQLGRALRISMGMSDDLEEAIAAGSDQVRIGTAFFGFRTGLL